MWTVAVSGRDALGCWGTLAACSWHSAWPSGGGTDSVGDVVAEAVRVVRESGLPNETTSMFTTIEAPNVGRGDGRGQARRRGGRGLGRRGSSLVLKADIRPGWTGQLQAKVERVERALGDPSAGEDWPRETG